jgi:hypothetical protein
LEASKFKASLSYVIRKKTPQNKKPKLKTWACAPVMSISQKAETGEDHGLRTAWAKSYGDPMSISKLIDLPNYDPNYLGGPR